MLNTRAWGDRSSRRRRWGKSPAGFPPPVTIVALSLLLTAFVTPRLATASRPAEGQAKPVAQPAADATVDAPGADWPPREWSGMVLDQRINEALQGKGEGAKLSPQQVIVLLQRKHEIESNTREWEMLDAVGHRAWKRLARRVAKRYPQDMRGAAAGESAVAREYRLLLGELGGKENLTMLIRQCDAKPSWTGVLALGRTGSREAWPALRRVVNRRLATDRDLNLANLALETLARAGDKEILPTMKKWLESDDVRKQPMVMRAAAWLGAEEFAADLRKADPKVLGKDRKAFYRALVCCGDDKYLGEVHAQARDESEFLRRSQERPPDPAMFRPNWNYTQNRALDAIAKLGSPRSLPLLDELAKKTADQRIRKRAAAIARAIRSGKLPDTIKE